MFANLAALLGLALISQKDLTPTQQSIGTVILGVGLNSIVRRIEIDAKGAY